MMTKIRVYELAKELNMNSKRLMDVLASIGQPVKNHMSVMEDDVVLQVKKILAPGKEDGREVPVELRLKNKKESPFDGETEGDELEKNNSEDSKASAQGQAAHSKLKSEPAAVPANREHASHDEHNKTVAKPVPRPAAPAANQSPRPGFQSHTNTAGSTRQGQVQSKPTGAVEQRQQGTRNTAPAGAQARPYQQRPQPNRPVGNAGSPARDQAFSPRKQGANLPGAARPAGTSSAPQRPATKGKPPVFEKKKTEGTLNKNAKPANANETFGQRFNFLAQKKKPAKHKKRKGQGAAVAAVTTASVDRESKSIALSASEIIVKDLATLMNIPAADIVKKLITYGEMVAINQPISEESAAVIAADFGFDVIRVEPEVVEERIDEFTAEMEAIEDSPQDLVGRAPVVVVMGHVDHGKTSLLDAIRQTKVTSSEAGGITQHIGAYQVKWHNRKITFLDTPGHEAFTAMRARGAQVTDIAVLVVAADDGVMPQTIEAIDHAKAAGVSMIVAINKIDKPNANPEHVLQGLSEHGLVAESWGGETITVNVSAKQRTGIEELLEMILLMADMHDLKANPKRKAIGTVIESKLDKSRGPVATVLVQNGTLKVGDPIVAGMVSGKVRAMMNERGERVKEARPSTPVEVTGFIDVPQAGDVMHALDNEKKAKEVANSRLTIAKDDDIKKTAKVTLDDLYRQIKEGQIKELNIIIKADLQGSTEAIKQSLEKIGNDEVRVNVIHNGVGGITETDVMLASASNAIIIGFNVLPEANAKKLAETENIDIRTYSIIYDAIEDIRSAMEGMLEPEMKEVIIGHAEVRELFKVPKLGIIGGSYVTDGKITRSSHIRVMREGTQIFEGLLHSLKRFKDDVKEVATGYECGIGVEGFPDLKEQDTIEAYILEAIKKTL